MSVGNAFRRPKASVLFVLDGELGTTGLDSKAAISYQVCTYVRVNNVTCFLWNQVCSSYNVLYPYMRMCIYVHTYVT